MNFETIFFFFFSIIALTSAIFVIYSTNTIYSAFFLILVFISTTGLLLISEVEFISIMLIIIYVGAITVLFLFVIMMLNINILMKKNGNFGYLPIIFLISSIFFCETFLMFSKIFTSYYNIIQSSFFQNNIFYNPYIYKLDYIINIETIGQTLYTFYAFFFLVAGIILLIALIGAVMLTKKEKKIKIFLTKNVFKQLSRNCLNAIFNIKKK
jgi:NADH-quinone oxidoreductase subunit J